MQVPTLRPKPTEAVHVRTNRVRSIYTSLISVRWMECRLPVFKREPSVEQGQAP